MARDECITHVLEVASALQPFQGSEHPAHLSSYMLVQLALAGQRLQMAEPLSLFSGGRGHSFSFICLFLYF